MEEQWPLIGCTTSEESTSDSEANHFNECLTVERVFPSVRGCMCPSVGGSTPEWEGVPQSGRVYPRVGECSPVWEGMPQCGRVCPVWEGVPSVGVLVPCSNDRHSSASMCSSDYRTLQPRG